MALLLIRSLVAPRKPTENSFAELVELVRNHVSPPPSAVVQRFHFNSCTQKDGETVGQFVAELRRLSEFCEFGPTLDGMLRDRLVCGIRDSRVQRRLLSEVNLTFSKAFELAKAAELAEKSVADLQRPVDTASVHAVQPVPPSSVSCHRCGGKHNASNCRVKSAVVSLGISLGFVGVLQKEDGRMQRDHLDRHQRKLKTLIHCLL